MNRQKINFWLFVLLSLSLAACAPAATPTPTAAEPFIKSIILATTTSTQDSGLLDVLVPEFQNKTGYLMKTVAVGTGQALKMGEECNADVLLVHAPSSVRTFMENGFGSESYLVMHNDFIMVGPSTDPAGIKGNTSALEAFQKIASASASFVSRGDDSGTHKMELKFWEQIALTPEGEWYIESGQGMGNTLKIASEKYAYTLTDRATYLTNKDILDLEILVEGDAMLLNIYHVIVVNPTKCEKINLPGAQAFAQFLISSDGQKMIGEFGVDEYGQPLFIPDAGKTEAELGLK